MRTVRWPSWPSATARLNAIVVLPTPPFGAKTDMIRVPIVAWSALKSLRTWAIRVIRSKPENGIEMTPWIAVRDVDLDRVLRDGQHDDRDAELRFVDHLGELGALDPALQQRVHEDHVRAQFGDLAERPCCRP